MAPQHERYSYGDPYATHADEPAGMGMAQCKRSGCPNMVRVMSNNNGRPMPEYCSNDCLVNNNKHQLTNPYAATSSSGNTMNNTPPSSVNNTTSATPTTPTWSPPEQHSSSTTTPPPSQQQQPPKWGGERWSYSMRRWDIRRQNALVLLTRKNLVKIIF